MKRVLIGAVLLVVLLVGYRQLSTPKAAEGPGVGNSPAGGGAPSSRGTSGGGGAGVAVVPAVVELRELARSLEVSGTLRTDEDVQVGTRLAGMVASVLVKEGDRVRRGQVLLRLVDREALAQLQRSRGAVAASSARLSLSRNQARWKDAASRSEYERMSAALAAARAREQQAETSFRLIDTEARLKVETAMSGVRVATERQSIVRDLTRKQELRQAQLAVDQAVAGREQARSDIQTARQAWERRKKLFEQDAIAREEVDEAERRYRAAEAMLRVAEADVEVAAQKQELAVEGSRPEEMRIADGQLNAAQRNLELAKSEEQRRDVARGEVGAAQAARRQAEAALASAEAGLIQDRVSLDEIRAAEAALRQARADERFYSIQLQDMVIRAPVSGVISRRLAHAGEMLTTSSRLFNLVADEGTYFEAEVPELDVSSVRPGLSIGVTVDSIPGRRFSGTVREVIPVADPVSRVYRVRVAVAAGASRLPVGGFARGVIRTGTRAGVPSIPREAVRSEAGDRFVWIAEPEGERLVARRRTVELGLISGDWVEVRRGLTVGQQLIRSGPPTLVDGAVLKLPGK